MIQRIQTVYLAIVAVACILGFFFPLAYFYNEMEGNYRFYIYGMQSMDPDPKVNFSPLFTLPLVMINIISLVFSVTAIVLFKKRALQARICTFNVLAQIIFLMVVFFFYIPKVRSLTSTEPEYNLIGMALPLVSLAMLILATRAIRKDEALVKSADRLR